jgi:hypothetical protein
MPSFANSVDESCPNGLVWLAGLLEAEGTFLKAPPSSPRCPVISCRMTDRDVVARVATMFGTRVVAIDKGRYRTEYAAVLKGSRAVILMRDLMPLMGERRRTAIDAATRGYVPPFRKLSFEAAEEIRRLHANGVSVSALSRSFATARQTIHQIHKREVYRAPKPTGWLDPPGFLREISSPPEGLSLTEFLWLAGWLEGEGSFLAPPPSDPRRPRVSGQSRDPDVISEVARLMNVALALHDPERTRRLGWSPTWKVLLRGSKAILLMQTLEPLMGARRRRQILSALDAAKRAGNAALAHAA